MIVGVIILSVVIIFLCSVSVWLLYGARKNSQAPVNIELLQKDITNSKEILEQQVQQLKEQLAAQNTIINDFRKNWTGTDREKTEKIAILITQLTKFQGSLDKKEDDYKRSADVIKTQVADVIKDLATLKESSNVLGKINDNIQTLQEVFVNTKKRGNVGEYLLEKILTNMLGANQKLWERQYQTNDGKIVDAYIKTDTVREGIAVDSKFSFDNYQKYFASEDSKVKAEYLKAFRTDIRRRIDEVAKYINLKNNISSAIMFIPSEEIFTFIYANFPEEVVEYAFKKRVWITSPTTLAAIIFTVDKNNKEVQINRNIESIRNNLMRIKEEFDRWITRWEKVKKGFETTNTAMSELDKTHNKLAIRYTNILEMPEELKESE